MNRIAYRSTSFTFAAITTLGMLKGIALLAVAPAEAPALVLPQVEVTAAAAQPLRLAANAR